jgi:caffeoyl-CoA O-methyltransferase
MECDDLFVSVDEYIEQLYGGDDAVLADIEAAAQQARLPQIAVSPVLGRYLHLLARLCRASSILEVGTLAGYSTIWLARALPPAGRLITIESDPDHIAVARQNIAQSGMQHLIELRAGRGLDVLPELQREGAGPFDLIFIDADKPPLAEYFEWSLRLARPGTLIVVDNVIREGRVLDPDHASDAVQGVRRFNELVAQSDAVTSSIVQTVGRKPHDGIALAIVK